MLNIGVAQQDPREMVKIGLLPEKVILLVLVVKVEGKTRNE